MRKKKDEMEDCDMGFTLMSQEAEALDQLKEQMKQELTTFADSDRDHLLELL